MFCSDANCANAKGMEDELEEMRKSLGFGLFRKMSCNNVLWCQIECFSVTRLWQIFGVSNWYFETFLCWTLYCYCVIEIGSGSMCIVQGWTLVWTIESCWRSWTFFLQPDGCFVVESKGAPQTTPPLTNHPPIGSNPPGWHLNSKKMPLPRIHMAARRWCKHQCTESPAPGDEEKLNIRHQVWCSSCCLAASRAVYLSEKRPVLKM